MTTDPIPMRIPCPACGELHIDEGEFATKSHHTHACQLCGNVWRPAVVATVGVKFLPGFKNETRPTEDPPVDYGRDAPLDDQPISRCCWKHWKESPKQRPMLVRMMLCKVCGNKRCPKATDCELACTNSNAPGQPWSAYQ